MKPSGYISIWGQRSIGVLSSLFLAVGVGLAQPPKAMVIVNSASGAAVVAPGSIASAFGIQVGAPTAIASLPLPLSLGGVTLDVTDSGSASTGAQLFYVSPNQINFVVPDATAVGAGTVTVTKPSGATTNAAVQVAAVAPGLFAANGAGVGVAAAIAIRRDIATQTDTSVPVFHCDANGCSSSGIDLTTPGSQVFLELFGTGIRGRSSLANVTATIGGESVDVLFAGAQGQFPGLDQVNLSLPTTFQPRGEQDIVLTVDGQVANKVRVNLQQATRGSN